MLEFSLFQWALFLLGSATLVFISRNFLLQPRSHGFYRFFAWEIIWVMFLGNTAGWFENPFVWYQLVSWALLFASLVLVILGVRLLRKIGKRNADRDDVSLYGFEKTSKLVTVGLYRYIRHPLYSSLLFLSWGIFFKSPSWLDLCLAGLGTFFLIATARIEEGENACYFGDEYREYMKRSKMFIPFIF